MPLQTLTLQPLLQGELRGHITTDTNIDERGPLPRDCDGVIKEKMRVKKGPYLQQRGPKSYK